jgi:pSer/pThr/pTyr-binding forkhead associated (FHA) protein
MYRLIYQDGDTPQAYTFTEGEVTIGRSPDCQIVLKDFGISPHPRQALRRRRGRAGSRT